MILLIIIVVLIIVNAQKFVRVFSPIISIDKVSSHINKDIKIYSTVAGAYQSRFGENLTYLHLDTDLPATKLIVLLYNEDFLDFILKPAEYYIGKKICVSGTISIFDGKIRNKWTIAQHMNLLKIKSEEISKYKGKFQIEVFEKYQIKFLK